MKFCVDCKNIIPDTQIVCLACTIRKSDEAVHRYQISALRRQISLHGELSTVSQRGVRHVRMFGVEKTFCGNDVAAKDHRGHIDFEELPAICPKCREEIERALEEAKA